MTLSKITKGKFIASGMVGMLYRGTDEKGNQYAVKVEHILKKDIAKDYRSNIQREVDFQAVVAKKHPTQFMQLLDYKIIDKCELKQKYSFEPKLFDDEMQIKLKKYAASPYCAIKLHNYIDGKSLTLKWIKTRKTTQMYSMICQITYAIYLMQSAGYNHRDIHFGNIGKSYTKDKFINILGYKIPTYGIYYCLLDFGEVHHRKYPLSTRDKKSLKEPGDIIDLANILYDDSKFWMQVAKANIKPQHKTQLIKKIYANDKYNYIKKITNSISKQIEIVKILHFSEFAKLICGEKSKNKHSPKLFIPFVHIKKYIKNAKQPKLIIKHFASIL